MEFTVKFFFYCKFQLTRHLVYTIKILYRPHSKHFCIEVGRVSTLAHEIWKSAFSKEIQSGWCWSDSTLVVTTKQLRENIHFLIHDDEIVSLLLMLEMKIRTYFHRPYLRNMRQTIKRFWVAMNMWLKCILKI